MISISSSQKHLDKYSDTTLLPSMLLAQSNLGRQGVRYCLPLAGSEKMTEQMPPVPRQLPWPHRISKYDPSMQPPLTRSPHGYWGAETWRMLQVACGSKSSKVTAVQWVCKYHTPPSSSHFETDISRFYIIMEDLPDKYAVILWICFPFKVVFFPLFFPIGKEHTSTQLLIYAFIQGHIQQHMTGPILRILTSLYFLNSLEGSLKTFIFPVVENLYFQEPQVTQQNKNGPELPTRLEKITNSVDQ